MVDKLEACPFCGGEGDMSFYARTSGPEPAGHFVECISCAAAGPGFDIQGEAPDRVEYTKAKAAEAWNTRATPTEDARARVVIRARVHQALAAIEHDTRVTDLTDAEIDTIIAATTPALGNKETDRHA